MEKARNIELDMVKKFGFLEGKFKITRSRRIFLDVPMENFMDVVKYAKEKGFDWLCTITGLDVVESFQAIYHLTDKDGCLLNLKISIPKSNPVIKTITGIFESGVYYERELKDLLGIEVEGLPAGRHYPLPDNWPAGQYPLRKDWKNEDTCECKDGGEK